MFINPVKEVLIKQHVGSILDIKVELIGQTGKIDAGRAGEWGGGIPVHTID